MAHLGLGVQDYGRRISMGAAVSFCGDQYMTPVQNQGKNNSCAAFAVSAALSALVAAEAIRNPFISAPNFSKQEIVDCFPIRKEGLYIQFSYGYVIGRGLHTEEEYEYVGDGLDHECRCFHLRGRVKWSIMDFQFLTTMDEILGVLHHHPITAGLPIYPSFENHHFQERSIEELMGVYSSGVNEIPVGVEQFGDTYRGEPTWHAVLVIGYGYHHGELYFIIKNSAGIWWGINGYAKVAAKMLNFFATPKHLRMTRIG